MYSIWLFSVNFLYRIQRAAIAKAVDLKETNIELNVVPLVHSTSQPFSVKAFFEVWTNAERTKLRFSYPQLNTVVRVVGCFSQVALSVYSLISAEFSMFMSQMSEFHCIALRCIDCCASRYARRLCVELEFTGAGRVGAAASRPERHSGVGLRASAQLSAGLAARLSAARLGPHPVHFGPLLRPPRWHVRSLYTVLRVLYSVLYYASYTVLWKHITLQCELFLYIIICYSYINRRVG